MNNIRSELKEISSAIENAGRAYRMYLEGGKKFIHAIELMKQNTAIYELLSKNLESFSPNQKEDALALMEHISIWSKKWNELKASLNPSENDVFVFENDHRFPRDAAERLIGNPDSYREQ